MNKDNNSPKNSIRDNARPTGDMSAEESHEYARKFQKENFGTSINVGGGRAEGDDAAATTQEALQKQNSNGRSENSKK
jgi:hypothetical protein